MSRSQAVRNEALELDGFRCQITGFDGRSEEGRKQLEVHHARPLGMGGSDELDTVENCITLRADIHHAVETGQLVIAEWCRGELLEVIDNQNVLGDGKGRVDPKLLWFYRRHIVEELEQRETRVHGLAMLDSSVAEDLYYLKRDKNWRELEPNTSFSAYCASRGWNASKASSLANLYRQSLETGVEWMDGETETDFKRRLKDAGKVEPRIYTHIRIRDEAELLQLIRQGSLSIVRCTDDKAAELDGIGVKAGKWFRVHSDNGELVGISGTRIPVRKLDTEGKTC